MEEGRRCGGACAELDCVGEFVRGTGEVSRRLEVGVSIELQTAGTQWSQRTSPVILQYAAVEVRAARISIGGGASENNEPETLIEGSVGAGGDLQSASRASTILDYPTEDCRARAMEIESPRARRF